MTRTGRRDLRRFVALIAALAAAVIAAGGVAVRTGPWDRPVPAPTASTGVAIVGGTAGGSWPSLGFTHTQYSADSGDPAAMDTAARALARQPLVQNQHIMGWGADNPEPAPGRYDFGSLDARVSLIRRGHGIPVITLCCAPDWMKGGRPGQTDWDALEVAPQRAHYGDFARLAAAIARRYPDVRYFVVWNEFKGFFDELRKRWAYEDYTDFYNQVYDALKAVDPGIKVGGPYMVMDSFSPSRAEPSEVSGPWGAVDRRALEAVRYWLRHKHGADFVAVDGATVSTDRGLVPDEFHALAKLSAVSAWLRRRSGGLPVWWAEWYVEPLNSGWSEAHRNAVQAAALAELARGGAATALYWNPGPGPDRTTDDAAVKPCPGCLWTPTSSRGGGRPLPALDLLQGFARWFPSGTRLRAVSARPSSVRVLAQKHKILIINTAAQAIRATVGGRSLRLKPYEVRWLNP